MTLRPRTLARRVGIAAASVAALAMALPPPAGYAIALPGAADLGAPTASRDAAGTFSVTLVTGDKVRVTPLAGGKYAVELRPAKGREHVPFATHRTKTGLTVTPADAVRLLAAGKLDPRLFDVLLLKKLGYDDRHTGELPLITSGSTMTSLAAPLPGARTMRAMPKLGLTSVREQKSDAATFWASFTAASRSAKPTVGKLWLVGTLHPTLDQSVRQVGAPAAWAAGQTGKGATVAVLDTGYDQNHADLKGVVSEARDFTQSAVGVRDDIGHGTHVASIIAGRGTASNGRYTGVAKGAQIKVGKVCSSEKGCREDAILAGMEWAAGSGAKVINMSLGGPARETGDFLEQAVNGLSAMSNVLFVIAAGNGGARETIGSPGTADAALTVGSVTKKDELSFFSSQGPRVAPSRRFDYAVKPDIAAPGQDIVAARAAGTTAGEPVGENYTRLSGTSMAAPHVAGAAAVLAAQHPRWTAAQLKSGLMSTAKRLPGLTVYQQGSGRLDVRRAVAQSVQGTGSLSLGYFPWPTEAAPAASKTVTYTNSGKIPVTLRLAVAARDDKDKPANKGMFTISSSMVVVPAGGSAPVTVMVTPSAGPTGLYSGSVTATSADGKIVVQTAIGAYKEPESYNLSVTAISRAGGRSASDVMLIDTVTGEATFLLVDGAAVRRMPVGEYTVASLNWDFPADFTQAPDTTGEVRRIKLGAVNEVVLDSRKGEPVQINLDRKDAVPHRNVELTMSQLIKGVPVAGTGVGNAPGHLYLAPGAGAMPGLELAVKTTFVTKGTGQPGQPATRSVYNVVRVTNDKVPMPPTFPVHAADLAKVIHTVHRQSGHDARDLYSFGFTPGFPLVFGSPVPLGDLTRRTDYYTTEDGVEYGAELDSGAYVGGWNSTDMFVAENPRAYQRHSVSKDVWNAAVFGPSFFPFPAANPSRSGDQIFGQVPLLSDATPAHFGLGRNFTTASSTLRRNGQVVWTTDLPGVVQADVPPGAATYRWESTFRRTGTWTQFTKGMDIAWTFTSRHVAGKPETLPLLVVRYSPALNLFNQAPAGGAFTIPVRVERASGSDSPAVTKLTVRVSYDGGKTWVPAPVSGTGGSQVVNVTHPAGAASVSLRATAADAAGNTVEQTIYDAYVTK